MPEITVRAKSKTYPVYINEFALETSAKNGQRALLNFLTCLS